eukprot:118474-Chlamydomonas_euryale.AAC.1
MATTGWLVSCQAVCQQLFLPTLTFKATDFRCVQSHRLSLRPKPQTLRQLLKDIIALPDLLLAAAAAPDGRGHLRRDI